MRKYPGAVNIVLERVQGLAKTHTGQKFLKYFVAGIGPICVAGSQFVLSLILLHSLPTDGFGKFSFLLILSQFSVGIWSALFCSPMSVLLSAPDPVVRETSRRSLLSCNLACGLGAMFLLAGIGYVVSGSVVQSLLYGCYGGLFLVRWFGRAYSYANEKPYQATISDVVYSTAVMAVALLVMVSHAQSLVWPYAGLLISCLLSIGAFGFIRVREQFAKFSINGVLSYGAIWRSHSGWSLVGVLTTEATVNAHAYIVTLVAGPTSFAPIAASALMMRPIGVVTTALTDFERPQMAREIAQNDGAKAMHSLRFFGLILFLTWCGAVGLAAFVTVFTPGILYPPQYDRQYLIIGMSLWLLVALIRLWRTPHSVLLQAAGQFRPLANASMLSAVVSLVAVYALLLMGGPLFSIVGVAIGESIFAVWVWTQSRRWRSGHSDLGQSKRSVAQSGAAQQ